MRKTLLVLIILLSFVTLSVAQENIQMEQCSVLEAEDAVLEDDTVIEEDSALLPDERVSVGENGSMILVCGDGFREVEAGSEGPIEEVAVRTDEFDTDIPEPEQGLEEALQDTEQIEQNLEDVNQMVNETVPDRIASIILGDNVNLQVDNTTIGIETSSSGITGVEENGFEEPDLEISMDGQSIERIMTSDNMAEEFREEFHGDGINVEAYTWRNRISLGVVNTTSRVYGFVSGFR